MDGDEALSILAGGHLDTVSFVMDYVELRVGYNVFRALRPPLVRLHDGVTRKFPEPGSRDALCQLIDSTVVAAKESVQDGRRVIEITNDAGDVVLVDIDGYSDSEFAHLVPADAQGGLRVADMYVW
jgi:hypothetical protein